MEFKKVVKEEKDIDLNLGEVREELIRIFYYSGKSPKVEIIIKISDDVDEWESRD